MTAHMQDGASVNDHGIQMIGLILMTTCMKDGALVNERCVQMIEIIKKVVGLKLLIPNEFYDNIVLLSLPSSFDRFFGELKYD